MLKGSFLAPASGKAKNMVVFLHGYGSNAEDLLGIGQEWASAMPDTVFAAPNAPAACEAFAAGYQWFSLRAAEGITSRAFDRDDAVRTPAEALNSYIDGLLAEWKIDDANLAVVGFSQGAMMAMYAMPRRKKPCAAVIGYSGLLVHAEGLKAPGIVKMPILAIHGQRDDVVPPDCLAAVQQGFEGAGFNVETVMRPLLAHSIDTFGLMRGLEFIKEAFEKQGKSAA
jgi:phospholipase/carboxylesterase